MSMKDAGPVIAGFDGAAHARQAIRWAANEAETCGAELLIVTCPWDEAPPLSSSLIAPPLVAVAELPVNGSEHVAQAGQQLDELAATVRRERPAVAVRTVVRDGTPESVLTDVAEEAGAALVVLGESGSGGFAAALFGRTEDAVCRSTERPVVVVHEAAEVGQGQVVLGVDGSPESEPATGFAFDFAARHGLALCAVHGRAPDPGPAADPLLGGAAPIPPPEDPFIVTAELCESRLRPWSKRFPDVALRYERSDAFAADALIERSKDAALLVVGRHGHGRFWRLLFGSAGRRAAHHAHCPVAIIRTP
jgi:nucleotide-binding universal stress UspA family protein